MSFLYSEYKEDIINYKYNQDLELYDFWKQFKIVKIRQEVALSRLKDKLLEVELFVGEQLEDYTNEQVIEKVRRQFGSQMYVQHAEELLEEFRQEVTLIRRFS